MCLSWYKKITSLIVLVVEDVEVDAFWNCDAADEEQEGNGCVAHCYWRRLVASCDISSG